MMLTCKCLNVSIQAGSTTPTPVEAKALDLTEQELADPFFMKSLQLVQVESIGKSQDSLITVHNIGSWVLHKCLNCKLDVYASRKQDIVISSDLLNDPVQIKELRQLPSFSPVFNIVLQPNIPTDLSARPNNRPISNSDPLAKSSRLASLNQQVSNYLQKISSDIEEKIRQFSEEQYSILEKERTKVQTEHRGLMKVVNDTDNISNNDSPLVFTPYQIKSPLNGANNVKRVSKPGVVTSSSARNSSDASDDFMFDLEDIEDPVNGNTAPSEEDMSDTDDSGSHDEGIHIPRMKQEDVSIAKSLPMNIPAFNHAMNNGREVRAIPKKKVDEDLRETQDIAASIKALARSVHGDTPFGDLPRPRLGSHI
ncbi:hypothetical protein M8J77_005595 [Diaphorina citri]|nr:hypothetical protein M8J77_005595 [Diaphorina citri]